MTYPCAQSIYGGCAGDQCDRDCTTRTVINLTSRHTAQDAKFDRLTWVMVGLALLAVFTVAGLYGASAAMDRVNQAYATERV